MTGGKDTAGRREPGLLRGLSGKVLVMTILFVMLGEVLIFLPSIANFRIQWLKGRIAQAEASTAGLVKIVTTRRGRILGAGIVGPGAGDLIQPWVLALERRLKIGAIASSVLPYPTRGEASRRAAIGYFADFASNALARRVIGWVKTVRP